MFDVDWSDPNRESVGDRRARKGKDVGKHHHSRNGSQDNNDGGHDDADLDDGEQMTDEQSAGNRTSGSVRSSVSSAEKQFGFFGGKHHHHRKKGAGGAGASASSRKGKTQSVASSSLRSPTIEEQSVNEVVTSRSTATSSPVQPRPSTSGGADKSPGLPPKRFSSEFCFVANPQSPTHSFQQLPSPQLQSLVATSTSILPHHCWSSSHHTTIEHCHHGTLQIIQEGICQEKCSTQDTTVHEPDH